jgi:hypothetical protein
MASGQVRVKLDRQVVQLVREHQAEYGIGDDELLFPVELLRPPRKSKPWLSGAPDRRAG